jgi:hypothetical protein
MAAFKAHATFGLWRGAELVDARPGQANAMGQFGRLTSVATCPRRKSLRLSSGRQWR